MKPEKIENGFIILQIHALVKQKYTRTMEGLSVEAQQLKLTEGSRKS